jgi:hypothetical protein
MRLDKRIQGQLSVEAYAWSRQITNARDDQRDDRQARTFGGRGQAELSPPRSSAIGHRRTRRRGRCDHDALRHGDPPGLDSPNGSPA